jgi:hypothetical protein
MRNIAKLFKRRRVFKRLADKAKYDRTRRFYAQEVYHCDEDIAHHLKRIIFGVNVLVLASILFVSGCATAKGTAHLFGGICQDVGWLATEIGDNINTEKE